MTACLAQGATGGSLLAGGASRLGSGSGSGCFSWAQPPPPLGTSLTETSCPPDSRRSDGVFMGTGAATVFVFEAAVGSGRLPSTNNRPPPPYAR